MAALPTEERREKAGLKGRGKRGKDSAVVKYLLLGQALKDLLGLLFCKGPHYLWVECCCVGNDGDGLRGGGMGRSKRETYGLCLSTQEERNGRYEFV